MSYCRFEGTAEELGLCITDLIDDIDLSDREANYANRLKSLCEEYLQAYDDWNANKEGW